MKIVHEYARITYRCNHPRSEEEEELIDDILKMAETNGVLEFWLSEIDHILGHLQGNLDEDARESYKDQYAVLREYLGEEHFDFAKPPKKLPLTKNRRSRAQDLLFQLTVLCLSSRYRINSIERTTIEKERNIQ
ncbi:MAG: hypothetical protein HC771_16405 [Synechococcales cyanobacterium CRU_2_2]|nr:hypothetical protein [Synechococcales cyanobacterium CRU_2_2]